MSGDEGPDVCVPVESKPELDTIYTALVGKGAVRRHGNLQCSGNSDDFCYLCAYCDQADSSGLLLKDHINSLVAQGKEVQQVARAIRKIYNAELREFAVHEKVTATGQVVNIEKPDWSVESIVRHLLLSPETEAVFETYQNQVYKSMILRQAERLVNVETGEVDASAARELLNTMRHFDDHKGRISNLGNKRRRVQSGLGSG